MSTEMERKGKDFLDTATDFMQTYLEPQDIFTDKQLAEWAESNGYVKE